MTSTPPLPIATSASLNWARVLVIGGPSKMALALSLISLSLSKFNAVGGFVFDPFPQLLEFLAFKNSFPCGYERAFIRIFDIQLTGKFSKNLFYSLGLVCKFVWQFQRFFFKGFSQAVLYPTFAVDVFRLPFKKSQSCLRLFHSQRVYRSVLVGGCQGGKLVFLDNAEANACILFDFLLKVLGKLFVAFSGNNGQRIDVETPSAVALPG